MPGETRFTSPSGRFLIYVNAWEARLSLWIETPEIYDTIANETLLRLRNSNWSLDQAAWQTENIVTMTVRKYPGDHTPSSWS
jgi:hypothetical protein